MGVALPGTKVQALGSGLTEGCAPKPAESLERLENILTPGANPFPAPNPWKTNSGNSFAGKKNSFAGKEKEFLIQLGVILLSPAEEFLIYWG